MTSCVDTAETLANARGSEAEMPYLYALFPPPARIICMQGVSHGKGLGVQLAAPGGTDESAESLVWVI